MATKNRNNLIRDARDTTVKQGGMSLNELRSTLQLQTSMSDSECINSFELFSVLIDIEKRLEDVNETYKIKVQKSRATMPKDFDTIYTQLHGIVDSAEETIKAREAVASGVQ
jgi:hypothetical protein